MADERVMPPIAGPTPDLVPPRAGFPSPRPVAPGERYGAMDVVRGFALLGILVPNVFFFAWPASASMAAETMGDIAIIVNPEAPVFDGANRLSAQIMSVGFMGKFMFLFSLLFGAGVWFFDRKTTEEGAKAPLARGAGLWYSRTGWLLLIGLAHAVGLWFGDILVWYAAVALTVLWWVRRWRPGALLGVGAASYVLGALMLLGITMLGIWSVHAGHTPPDQLTGNYQEELTVYRTGSYPDMVLLRVKTLAFMYIILLPFGMFWTVGGVMLTGLALVKLRVLTGERSTRVYAIMALVGIGLGLPLSAGVYGAVHGSGSDFPGFIWQSIAQPVGILQGFGYLGLVLLLARSRAARFITVPLAAVGRMALSNYLLQTLICTTVFYAYGGGLFGEVQFPLLWGVIFGVWFVNIVFSMLWLSLFRFGPAEWAWRSLTYLRPQPMLKTPGV